MCSSDLALYDINSPFLSFLHAKLSKGEPVNCFIDRLYSPTYSKDFLKTLDRIIMEKDNECPLKIYHSCGEVLSRYDFALLYAKVFGFNTNLIQQCKYKQTDNLFLFPNLSMSNDLTYKQLQIDLTKTKTALMEIKEKVKA